MHESSAYVPAAHPDIVLMDILMPVVDGITAADPDKHARPEGPHCDE